MKGRFLSIVFISLLADIHYVYGRFQPYAGITLGGGAATTLLMDESPSTAWAPINGTLYHRQGFMALDPYIGCDFIVGKAMHLTLKADCLHCFGSGSLLPIGPRVYFGFLFYH